MKRRASGTRSLILAILFVGTVIGCAEKMHQYIQKSVQEERYYDPFGFNYYPAMVLLQNGDTIKGRFTKYKTNFYLLHENPDSNYHCDKNKNQAMPEDYYYKKYLPSEMKAYVVNDQRFEPVRITYKKTDASYKPIDMFYDFMIRLTPDSLSMQLYKHLEPDNQRSTVSEMLYPPDTTINDYNYFIQYYLHFPDEHPVVVWRLDAKLLYNKRLKQRMTETFRGCPALAETARNIEQVSNNEYIFRVMSQPDSTIKTKGIQALVERIKLFDACYRETKHIAGHSGQ